MHEAYEDTLLALADHLPAEAAEALLELATGGTPRAAASPPRHVRSRSTHPDAQRRFRVMSNVEELERALDFPWEKWTVFLHPEQRELVERDYAGPARVVGFGRNRQDDRGPASRRLPGAHASRGPGPARRLSPMRWPSALRTGSNG